MAAIKQSVTREHGRKRTDTGLDALGIRPQSDVYWNLNTPELYEIIARRGEGVFSAHGALMVDTGEHTGRAAKDKAIVREPSSEEKVFWGEVNKEFPQEKFDRLRERMMKYASTRELFVQDTYAGADTNYRLPVRIITELAWHSLFARTMFINDDAGETKHTPEFTVINIPSFKADPAIDGTRAETFILVDFGQRLVLIGGTSYAGETKKSVFGILNYLLPQRGVMSMHCSANVGQGGRRRLLRAVGDGQDDSERRPRAPPHRRRRAWLVGRRRLQLRGRLLRQGHQALGGGRARHRRPSSTATSRISPACSDAHVVDGNRRRASAASRVASTRPASQCATTPNHPSAAVRVPVERDRPAVGAPEPRDGPLHVRPLSPLARIEHPSTLSNGFPRVGMFGRLPAHVRLTTRLTSGPGRPVACDRAHPGVARLDPRGLRVQRRRRPPLRGVAGRRARRARCCARSGTPSDTRGSTPTATSTRTDRAVVHRARAAEAQPGGACCCAPASARRCPSSSSIATRGSTTSGGSSTSPTRSSRATCRRTSRRSAPPPSGTAARSW